METYSWEGNCVYGIFNPGVFSFLIILMEMRIALTILCARSANLLSFYLVINKISLGENNTIGKPGFKSNWLIWYVCVCSLSYFILLIIENFISNSLKYLFIFYNLIICICQFRIWWLAILFFQKELFSYLTLILKNF